MASDRIALHVQQAERVLDTLAVLLAVAACAGDGEDRPSPDGETAADRRRVATPVSQTSAGAEAKEDETTLVALAKGETLDVWSAPCSEGRPERTIRSQDEASREILLVVRQQLASEWLEAHLPVAPGGVTGWVKRDDVTLSRHRFRIEVERSTHRLVVYDGDRLALDTPVAIGSSDAPPAGPKLFIKELIETPDPDGAYGSYAYGLSGSNNLVESFEAGTGVVGIHGTDDESSLGQDVPTGSLAIGREPLTRMVDRLGLPLGTPVEILP